MPNIEQVRNAAEQYAAAVASCDRERIVSCFSADAVVVDPYPAQPNIGHEAISAFWDNVLSMGTPETFIIEKIALSGDSAAFLFSLVMQVGGSSRLEIEGFDVVRVDDDGKIASLTAYWDPTSMKPLD